MLKTERQRNSLLDAPFPLTFAIFPIASLSFSGFATLSFIYLATLAFRGFTTLAFRGFTTLVFRAFARPNEHLIIRCSADKKIFTPSTSVRC